MKVGRDRSGPLPTTSIALSWRRRASVKLECNMHLVQFDFPEGVIDGRWISLESATGDRLSDCLSSVFQLFTAADARRDSYASRNEHRRGRDGSVYTLALRRLGNPFIPQIKVFAERHAEWITRRRAHMQRNALTSSVALSSSLDSYAICAAYAATGVGLSRLIGGYPQRFGNRVNHCNVEVFLTVHRRSLRSRTIGEARGFPLYYLHPGAALSDSRTRSRGRSVSAGLKLINTAQLRP